MARIPEQRLAQLIDRYEAVEARLASASAPEEIRALSREHRALRPVVGAARALAKARSELGELEALSADAGADAEMRALAADELYALKERLPRLERDTQLLLLPKDADDEASAMLEIRAGTGGSEAALFAGDLFRMYHRYAQARGWRVELVSESLGEAGGYKEIIASVEGEGVFGRLKWESGVHRVQRVPLTEAGGRIHTSAATVAVLAEPEDVEIDIKPDELKIETMRSSGAGGQHVNKTESAVRITHLPTGIVATSSEKSQHQNRANAMKVLKSRIYEAKRAETDAARAADRKAQVGSGDRSERIRTYNFPQGRVTDHRIGLTTHTLPQVLEGDLDEVIDALLAHDQAEKLAALEGEG